MDGEKAVNKKIQKVFGGRFSFFFPSPPMGENRDKNKKIEQGKIKGGITENATFGSHQVEEEYQGIQA